MQVRTLAPASLALLLTASLSSLAATAAEPAELPLWPSPAPTAAGIAGDAAEDRPRLILHRAESTQPTAAVVVLPGGGYGSLAAGHEGTEIAQWLNSMGVTAAICMYRHRNTGAGYGYPYPLRDAQRAIALVRHHAAEWNIDPERVGIIGFSAGGHLASSVATATAAEEAAVKNLADDAVSRQNSRPDFAILGYPVIAFGQPFTHVGSQQNLLGPDVTPARLAEMSTQNRVTENTPPTFLFHTTADTAVPPQNSLVFYQALVEKGVPAELHIFEQGPHGVGLAKNIPATSRWPELCRAWLESHGVVEK